MIVVPMSRYDQPDCRGGVDPDTLQVPQGMRSPVGIEAGVNDDPGAVADMQDDALSITRTEDGDLEVPGPRRPFLLSHGLSDREIRSAHFRPSSKSAAVILGRSRKTICETRFVPDGERS